MLWIELGEIVLSLYVLNMDKIGEIEKYLKVMIDLSSDCALLYCVYIIILEFGFVFGWFLEDSIIVPVKHGYFEENEESK